MPMSLRRDAALERGPLPPCALLVPVTRPCYAMRLRDFETRGGSGDMISPVVAPAAWQLEVSWR
jgi:hypothetical protein